MNTLTRRLILMLVLALVVTLAATPSAGALAITDDCSVYVRLSFPVECGI